MNETEMIHLGEKLVEELRNMHADEYKFLAALARVLPRDEAFMLGVIYGQLTSTPFVVDDDDGYLDY